MVSVPRRGHTRSNLPSVSPFEFELPVISWLFSGSMSISSWQPVSQSVKTTQHATSEIVVDGYEGLIAKQFDNGIVVYR